MGYLRCFARFWAISESFEGGISIYPAKDAGSSSVCRWELLKHEGRNDDQYQEDILLKCICYLESDDKLTHIEASLSTCDAISKVSPSF